MYYFTTIFKNWEKKDKTKRKITAEKSREHRFPVDNSSPRAKGPTGTDDSHLSTSQWQSEEGIQEANKLRVSILPPGDKQQEWRGIIPSPTANEP